MTNASSPALVDADPASFLGGDDIVQTDHPDVVALALELRATASSPEEFTRAAFEWVRERWGTRSTCRTRA